MTVLSQGTFFRSFLLVYGCLLLGRKPTTMYAKVGVQLPSWKLLLVSHCKSQFLVCKNQTGHIKVLRCIYDSDGLPDAVMLLRSHILEYSTKQIFLVGQGNWVGVYNLPRQKAGDSHSRVKI